MLLVAIRVSSFEPQRDHLVNIADRISKTNLIKCISDLKQRDETKR
jgi:hypothetical protein